MARLNRINIKNNRGKTVLALDKKNNRKLVLKALGSRKSRKKFVAIIGLTGVRLDRQ